LIPPPTPACGVQEPAVNALSSLEPKPVPPAHVAITWVSSVPPPSSPAKVAVPTASIAQMEPPALDALQVTVLQLLVVPAQHAQIPTVSSVEPQPFAMFARSDITEPLMESAQHVTPTAQPVLVPATAPPAPQAAAITTLSITSMANAPPARINIAKPVTPMAIVPLASPAISWRPTRAAWPQHALQTATSAQMKPPALVAPKLMAFRTQPASAFTHNTAVANSKSLMIPAPQVTATITPTTSSALTHTDQSMQPTKPAPNARTVIISTATHQCAKHAKTAAPIVSN
jgi:hypothetical protein